MKENPLRINYFGAFVTQEKLLLSVNKDCKYSTNSFFWNDSATMDIYICAGRLCLLF